MDLMPDTTCGVAGLRAIRKRLALTQEELARMVGLHRGTVTNYEIGAQDPKLSVVRKLAAALNCTVADLLTEPKPALVPAEELAQTEAELKDLEARIARLKAEVGQ